MRHALPAALILLLAGTASVLAQRAAPARPHADCLRVGQVEDFQPSRDNRSLIVTDRRRNKYKVFLLGVCPDLKYRIGLAFHARAAAGGLACLTPGDEVIMRRQAGIGGHCPIQKIVPYTREMERADAAAEAARARRR